MLVGMPPFWISIAALSLVQGAVVACAQRGRVLRAPLRGRAWAAVPPLSVLAFVFVARAAERASADALTYLALAAVPLLAALCLGWLAAAGRPRLALAVAPLFALAWADRGGLAGEGAAVLLTALSCVALGALLAAVTPPRWLGAGIVAMAVADSALVLADLLQRPNNALNAARPAAGLPRLQSAVLGSAVMGYGDLFVAGVLGGLLAVTLGGSAQLRAGLLTAAIALCFDLLFFAVDELPATVPVALALIVLALRRRLRSAQRADARRPPRGGRAHPAPRRAPAR
jgi:hypothetical protein